MGEQPIFTTKAHVFQIDPTTKKKWLPASSQSVNVSYYYDNSRDSYRIISVEGSKAVINSTITPNMTFTKTSQKFGQWSDPRANTVYGLGFSSEGECTKFVEKFKEVKELTRQAANKSGTTNGTGPPPPPAVSSSPATPVHSSPDITHNSPIPSPKPGTPQISNDNERNTSTGSTQVVDQLKYENDRLKIALAQSSANAKKWEVELQTLKNNNARLTTALQESTANVEEWKKQLAMYKEESVKQKKKVLELEKAGGGSELLQRQIVELRDKIHDMERASQSKQDEILNLNKRMGEVKNLEVKNQELHVKLQEAEKEKAALHKQLSDQRELLDQAKAANIRLKQTVRGIHDAVGTKINEMYELNDKLAELMQS